MTTTRQTVRIFISSPGDVAVERGKARQVIDGLERLYPGVTLQPVLWEDLALPATASFQQSIDVLLHQQRIDIAVFILWSRLGSPLGTAFTRSDGTPYRSGTEREFDLMLAAFAQSGNQRPVILAYSRDDDSGFGQALTNCPVAQWEELITQQKLAKSFIREQFHDAEGRNLRAYHSYGEPVSFAQRLHTHLRPVLEELLGVDAAPRWLEAPYRGLAFFEVAHADIFQGRDEETCDLLQRLRDQEQSGCVFAVIVGASGSGKSSLARAGVAAALMHHAYDESVKEWRVISFIPGLGGRELCSRLMRALAEQLPELGNSTAALDDIASGLETDARLTVKLTIVPAFARARETARGAVRVLLILDQMEELWTDRRITAEDRERFLAAIEALARSGHVAVLATLRSDFYPHAQLSATFLRLKGERGHCDLPPPGAAALQRLITEPARLAGLRFERDEPTGRMLDEVILRDAARDPAALPLLQYALSELYYLRDDRTLTFAAYERLGGVEGAVGKRAADTFKNLPAELRAALPEILPLLVTVDVAGEQTAVRRRAPLADLTATPARRLLTESLIAARFLTTDRQEDTAIASLAHEALLRRWGQIADWITANREQLRLRARVEQNQQRWEQQGRDPSLLLTPGLPLEEGRQLLVATSDLLLPETAKYIRASIARDQAELARKRRRRRAVMAGMTVLTILALVGGAVAWIQQEAARKATDDALELAGKNEQLAIDKGQLADSERAAKTKAEEQTSRTEWQLRIATAERLAAMSHTKRSDSPEVSLLLAVESGRATMFRSEDLLPSSHQALLDALAGIGGRPLTGHFAPIHRIAISPDGRCLVTMSPDNIALVWALTTEGPAAIPRVLTGHRGIRGSVAISSNNRWLLMWSVDETVRVFRDASRVLDETTTIQVWDLMARNAAASSRFFLELQGSNGSAAISTDSRWIVAWSDDRAARIWDLTADDPAANPRVLTEYEGSRNSVAISPDSRWIVTEGMDNTARVWDLTADDPAASPRVLRGHTGAIASVAISADSRWIVTHDKKSEETARVWDLTANPSAIDPRVLTETLRPLAFSADNHWLITVSSDKTARVWDLMADRPFDNPRVLTGHQERIDSLTISPDSRWLVTQGGDDEAGVWDLTAENPAANPHFLSGNHVKNVAISADSRWIVTSSGGMLEANPDKSVRVWDLRAKNPYASPGVLTGHQDMIISVAISPDSRWIVAGSMDNTARVWDLTAENQAASPRVLKEHERRISGVEISPDGRWLVTLNDDHMVRAWDLAAESAAANPRVLSEPASTMAISPDSRWLVTWTGALARVWDLAAANPAENSRVLSGHQGDIQSVMITPDGRRIVTASKDATARVWDLTADNPSAQPLVLTGHEDSIKNVAISPDGRWIVTVSENATARVWDVAAANPSAGSRFLNGHGKIKSGAISPDGRWIVTVSDDATAAIWDLADENSSPLPRILIGNVKIESVAISPDSRYVVAIDGNTVRAWNLLGDDPAAGPRVLTGHLAPVNSMAISPDSRWIVTGAQDKTARVWDLTAEDPAASARVLTGHQDSITRIAISSDSRWVVTGAGSWGLFASKFDKTARVWDLKAQNPSASQRVLGDIEPIYVMAIGAAGRSIVTGSIDQTARVWCWQWDDLVALAGKAGRNFDREEWRLYFGDEPYRKTFPERPVPNDPQTAQEYAMRGRVRFLLDDLDHALSDYTASIQLDPQGASAYIGRGGVWAKKGKLDQAADDYREGIQIDPGNAQAAWWLYEYGSIRAASRKWTEAAENLAKAARPAPDNIVFLYLLGVAQRATGDTKAYRQSCHDALERFGKAPTADSAQRILCMALPGNGLDAAELVRLAKIADGPQWLGPALCRAGRYEESLNVFAPGSNEFSGRAWNLPSRPLPRTAPVCANLRESLVMAREWIANADRKPEAQGGFSEWGGWWEKADVSVLLAEVEELLAEKNARAAR